MKVILTKNIKKGAKFGDIKEIALGYAKYLLKQGWALIYNEQNAKKFESIKKKEITKLAVEKTDAEAIVAVLNNKEIKFKEKAQDGKLYGSITIADVAKYIKDEFKIDIDKKKIGMQDHLKELGSFNAHINLHPDLECKMTILVEEETEKDEK